VLPLALAARQRAVRQGCSRRCARCSASLLLLWCCCSTLSRASLLRCISMQRPGAFPRPGLDEVAAARPYHRCALACSCRAAPRCCDPARARAPGFQRSCRGSCRAAPTVQRPGAFHAPVCERAARAPAAPPPSQVHLRRSRVAPGTACQCGTAALRLLVRLRLLCGCLCDCGCDCGCDCVLPPTAKPVLHLALAAHQRAVRERCCTALRAGGGPHGLSARRGAR
jgi:hypothetical protein